MDVPWVDTAQIVSGITAVAALLYAANTARASRRQPLAESYLQAWETILSVVSEASLAGGSDPFPVPEADRLLREYKAADDRLAVLEAALGVKAYGRAVRHDVANILVDVLYEDAECRQDLAPLSREAWEPPAWADPDAWERMSASAAISCLLCNHIFDRPGSTKDQDDIFEWYAPRVLDALRNPASVYSPDAPVQQQLARLLADYQNDFLMPWVRDATREALLGRRNLRGHRMVLHKYRRRRYLARSEKRWRKHHPQQEPAAPRSHSSLFGS